MKRSGLEEGHFSNYSTSEVPNVSCSGHFKGTSNNSSRSDQTATFNNEHPIRSRKEIISKNNKLRGSGKTDLLTDTNHFLSTVALDLNEIPLKRHLQIVIMGDSFGAPLSQEETLDILQFFTNKINSYAYQHHGPELKFHSSTVLKTGWILLNCHDESTFQWVFDWTMWSDKSFKVVEASAAPWKPARVCLAISEMAADVNDVIKILISQNYRLRLDTWKHVETHKVDGFLYLHFLVPSDGVWSLESSCWKVHFVLGTLSVSVVEVQSTDMSVK